MSENNGADSDTDVSSNSSWTVLDETPDQNTNIESGDGIEKDEVAVTLSTPEIFSELEIVENDSSFQETQPADLKADFHDLPSDYEDGEENTNHLLHYGCLTFDEYMQERELEYDYEYDTKNICFDEIADKKSKPDKRKRKKCKAESLGTLAIIGTVLAVAGVSFLCLLTPSDYVLTGKEIEKLKNNTTEVLNTSNASVPVRSVLCNNSENKLTVVDSKHVLQKCFKKHATCPKQARKCFKGCKQFKYVKTLNLLDDDDSVKVDEPSSPLTYDEYFKQSQQYLNSIKNGEKSIRDILKKAPLFTESKIEKALQVFEEPPNPVTATKGDLNISKKKNDEETPVIKSPTTKARKLVNQKVCKRKHLSITPETTCVIGKQQNNLKQKCPKPKVLPYGDKANEAKKNELVQVSQNKTEPHKITAIEEDINALNQSKIVCNVLQDIMLLRMTSKIARRLREKQEGKHAKVSRKTLRLQKLHPSICSIDESQAAPQSKQYKKPTIKEKPMSLRKKEPSPNTTLALLDELPFSKRQKIQIPSKFLQNRNNVIKYGSVLINATKSTEECDLSSSIDKKRMHKNEKFQSSYSIMLRPKEDLPSHEKLTRDIENLKKKQTDFLEKLKKQQSDRMKYLRLIRERQQESIQALIKERRSNNLNEVACKNYENVPVPNQTEMKIMQALIGKRSNLISKDVSCGKYDVPIPSATEVTKRLLELKNRESSPNCSCGFRSYPYRYYSRDSLSERKIPDVNCSCSTNINTCRCEQSKTNCNQSCSSGKGIKGKLVSSNSTLRWQKDEVDNCQKNVKNSSSDIPAEYMNMKKKYYERIRNYWHKREEYLNERISFMNEVKSSIKEIMNNYRNNQNNALYTSSCSEPTLNNIVNEAISVFPDDSDMQQLKTQFSAPKEMETSSNCSSYSASGLLERNETKTETSCAIFDPSVFQFTAQQYQVSSNSMNVRNDTIYNCMFGKKGQQIRKRDLAMWYGGKISKNKRGRETSKSDLRRLSSSRKAKREF